MFDGLLCALEIARTTARYPKYSLCTCLSVSVSFFPSRIHGSALRLLHLYKRIIPPKNHLAIVTVSYIGYSSVHKEIPFALLLWMKNWICMHKHIKLSILLSFFVDRFRFAHFFIIGFVWITNTALRTGQCKHRKCIESLFFNKPTNERKTK